MKDDCLLRKHFVCCYFGEKVGKRFLTHPFTIHLNYIDFNYPIGAIIRICYDEEQPSKERRKVESKY